MLNKFIGIGRLGQDPETRHTTTGKSVCNFSVACNSGYGENKSTEWVKCVAWERLAEVCGEYLTKGSQVYIEGRLQTRQWEDKEGYTKYTTEVVLYTMQMLSSNKPNQNYTDEPIDSDDIPF